MAAPADGTAIPANTQALYWSPWHGVGTPELFDDFGQFHSVSLVADPGWSWARYVIPNEPLQPGAFYRLRYWVDCSGAGSPDGGAWHEQRFKVEGAAPPPTSMGPVTVGDEGMREVRVTTARGSCFYNVPAAAARFTIALPSEAAPWLAMARVSTSVDGKPWASTYWGGFDPTRGAQCGVGLQARQPDVVFARCGAHDGGYDLYDDPGLDPGPHHAEVTFEIPRGAAVHASADFVLTCVDVPGLDGSYPDPRAPPDGGCLQPAWDAPPLRPFAKRGCGCGLGAGGTAGALLMLAFWRRRRA
jgi:hypothetical protein